MSNSVSMTVSMNIATNEYFKLRQIYNKKINEISIIVKEKVYNDKVDYANTIRDWSNDEKNKYIDTYTKPDSSNILRVTDFVKENSLKKEMKNNIYKEACLLIINIINKYFDIRTLDGTDEDYKIIIWSL